jgi:hypothetical protein
MGRATDVAHEAHRHDAHPTPAHRRSRRGSAVNALHPDAPLPGPRLCHWPGLPEFQALKQQLESGWITLLRGRVGLARTAAAAVWL